MSEDKRVGPDLEEVLQSKDHLSDVSLRGTDGRQIPSFRLLLSARSPVFERMLNGDFAESDAFVVGLDYDSNVVEAISAYCISCKVQVSLPKDTSDAFEERLRGLACLLSASHFFELLDMEKEVLDRLIKYMKSKPKATCVLYDEAAAGRGRHEELAQMALDLIYSYGYCAVEPKSELSGFRYSTGVLALSEASIGEVIHRKLGLVSEFMKFRLLLCWRNKRTEENFRFAPRNTWDANNMKRHEVASKLVKQIQLHLIPPSELSTTVLKTHLVAPEDLAGAFQTQALHAQEKGFIFGPERVVVQGSGIGVLNGNYYPQGKCDGTTQYVKRATFKKFGLRLVILGRQIAKDSDEKWWWIAAAGKEETSINKESISFYRAPVSSDSKDTIPATGWRTLQGHERMKGEDPPPKEVKVVMECGVGHNERFAKLLPNRAQSS